MTKIFTANKVTVTCSCCGAMIELIVPARGYRLWMDGEPIHKAMPDLTVDDRETLTTELCADCRERWYARAFDGIYT